MGVFVCVLDRDEPEKMFQGFELLVSTDYIHTYIAPLHVGSFFFFFGWQELQGLGPKVRGKVEGQAVISAILLRRE
jgi:hypothetical protein